VNEYLDRLSLRTNAPGICLKRIPSGVENMTMISAKDVPGVLLQVVFHFFHLRFITIFLVIFTIIFFSHTRLHWHSEIFTTRRRVFLSKKQSVFNAQLDSSLQFAELQNGTRLQKKMLRYKSLQKLQQKLLQILHEI
jgi:hypothetical protein